MNGTGAGGWIENGSGSGGYLDGWEWMGPRHWQHNYMADNAMRRCGFGEGE